MRIIGGKFKGRKLNAPYLPDTRPTTDFARESLFNLLQTRIDIEDCKILDLFCGTGAVTLEFLSRGAQEVVAVDLSTKGLLFLRDTSKLLEVKARTVKADVFKFLNTSGESFDLVFADPPYELKNLEQIPALVLEKGLLKKNGLLIVEHGKRTDLSAIPGFVERREYGKVNFSFFSC